MDTSGYIEIRITGAKGNIPLSPEIYDVRDLVLFLENAEDLLFPNDKKNRPLLTHHMESGSVKHILKTTLQYVIGFNAVIGRVQSSGQIDFLDPNTASAIEEFQDIATKKDYAFEIKTSIAGTNQLTINRHTFFRKTDAVWLNADFYFYGKVVDAGGKDKANIHMVTNEHGNIRISTPVNILEGFEKNILYKTFGIRAQGRQHSGTGEIDVNSLRFVEMIDYEQAYNERYINELRNKAKTSWLGAINPDEWLREIRGGYEA